MIERPKAETKGRYKAICQVDEMDRDILDLAQAVDVVDMPLKTNIPFRAYN